MIKKRYIIYSSILYYFLYRSGVALTCVYGAGGQGRAVVVGIVGDDHQGGGGGQLQHRQERTSYDTQKQPSTDKQK